MDSAKVIDRDEKVHDLETAQAFDLAEELDKNHAEDPVVAERAKRVVLDCIARVESGHQTRIARWRRMNDLWWQHSVSKRASEMGVHMGGPFRAIEEYAIKMKSAIFGQTGFISGTSERYEDGEKGKLTALMIEDQMRNEAKLPQTALEDFRTTAIYGVRIGKVVARKRAETILKRELEVKELGDGDTEYIFGKVEEEEIGWTENLIVDVPPEDFRIEPTSDSVKDAGWCGDYSYPTTMEIDERIARNEYLEAPIHEFFERWKKSHSDKQVHKSSPHRSIQGHLGTVGNEPDAGPHIEQFCCFEWWGDFDLRGNGKPVPCVITILVPASQDTPTFKPLPDGAVVQIRRNPYHHGQKPYVAHPLFKRRRHFWSMSMAELVGKHSSYSDDLHCLALLAGEWEASPMWEVADAAEIGEHTMDGFLPGKNIPVAEGGHISPLAPPVRSGAAVQLAEYFSRASNDVAGMGMTNAAPRVAAAGLVRDAQEVDERLKALIDAYENCFLVEAAELFHGLNQQYMTRERKVKTLGVQGLSAPDMTTVTPADIRIGMRFEPTVGRKLAEKAFQNQAMINWWDRSVQDTMMRMQTGQPPLFNLEEMAKRIFRDVFGITDWERLVHENVEGVMLRATDEEHRLFALGEVPSVQKGEKTWVHLYAHLKFLQEGGADDWEAARRQALIDHITETLTVYHREVEAMQPGTGEMLAAMFMPQIMEAGGPSTGMPAAAEQGAQGGRGYRAPGGSPGSPLFGRETGGMTPMPTQGNTMQSTANLGAQ